MSIGNIRLEIASELGQVYLASNCIKKIASHKFNTENCSLIELCCTEAINNCIEHAYSNDSSHTVEVNIILKTDMMIIEINDKGIAMPVDLIDKIDPEFNFNKNDIDSLPEGGMGLKIIKSHMDEILYSSNKEKNTLTLIKKY